MKDRKVSSGKIKYDSLTGKSEIHSKDCSVRLILVYGPQENDSENHDISVQVEMAYLNGDSVTMVGDLNAKLGYDVIPKDLHPMSNNGEQLFELCNKYNLKLMNASEHCEGVFTRIHKYKQTIEKSVLDYVLSHHTWKSALLPCKLMRKSILHHGVALNMVKDILTIVLLSFA